MGPLIVLAVISIMCNAVLWRNNIRLQVTLDRLTDKLMARDYKEYVSMNQRPTEPEKPRRQPMSWHDDPNIDDDEITN